MGTRATIAAAMSLLFFLQSCLTGKQKNEKNDDQFAPGTREGMELAKHHCGNCHQFVPAHMLDKTTWRNHVLPGMAKQLGITVMWEKEFVDEQSSGSLVAFRDFMKIVDYYVKTAPDSIELPTPVKPATDTTLFSVRIPQARFSHPVRTVMVVADTLTGNFYTGDGFTDRIYRWNKQLTAIDSAKVYSPPSYMYFVNGGAEREAVITTMGTMDADDSRNGRVLRFDLNKSLSTAPDTLATGMPRSIQSIPADFNKDGLTDWLVCGFGRASGALYWLKNTGSGKYSRETIVPVPGATQAIIDDFNKDGWPDIMVLFAHAEESIRLLTNNKAGGFTETVLLSFPPVYGSTSFQLADFNNDGLKDIVYTCGDNADLSQVLKPFHGVYIFFNQGNNKYVQEFFYHINGTTKAIVKDFDNDGDLDIATINFYADYKNNPSETFILLRQKSPMKFEPISPQIARLGRWLTMDASDFDGDGDVDIMLGNFGRDFLIEKTFAPTWDLYTPFIVLENKSAPAHQ